MEARAGMTREEVLTVRRGERSALSKSLWKGVRGETFLPRKVSPEIAALRSQ
jgi:hypothetical protein